MKPITKIVIFLVVAFLVIIAITFATRSAEAPTNPTSASHETLNPNATPVATQTPSTPGTGATYTLADVAKHATKADCWTAVNGSVYNLTSFIPNHPGGDRILVVCGKDGTAAFENQHDSQRDPAKELATHKIGTLAK